MPLTRSTNQGDLQFDPEIERTFRRLEREARKFLLDFSNESNLTLSDSETKEVMANNNQTIKQLATPDLNLQFLSITFPNLVENATFELKSGLNHLLPSFHGLAGEDPHKHLKEFQVVCSSMC